MYFSCKLCAEAVVEHYFTEYFTEELCFYSDFWNTGSITFPRGSFPVVLSKKYEYFYEED